MSSKQKQLKATLKLVINAGQAKPAPPVGPALGQAGLNIMSFCKDFNAKTADLKPDVPVPVVIKAYTDKSYEYVTKTPPTSYFVKKALGIESGSQRPGQKVAGKLSVSQVLEIAKVKAEDTPEIPLPSICQSIIGSCKSMGVEVVQGS